MSAAASQSEASQSDDTARSESEDLHLAPLGSAPPPASPRSLRDRVFYLLLIRTVITTILLVTTIVLRLGAGQSVFEAASLVLIGVCVGNYVSILVGALWLRWRDAWGIVPLAYLQLFSDSVVAAVLVVSTGGYESAFVFLFSLAILNAAAVVGRRGALVLGVVNASLYVAIVVVQVSEFAARFDLSRATWAAVSPSMVANILAYFLVSILAGSLTEQLRRASEGLDVAKAQLAEVGALHEAVLRSLPSGVLTVDDDGRIVFFNDAAREILRRAPSDLIGDTLEHALPGIPPHASLQERFEVLLPRQEQMHVIGGSVARLAHASAVGTVIVFQDLTELRRLQAAVARAERLQTVGRFAAGLAHEVRNPLAAIVGCLQLLEHAKDLGDDDARRMVDIAHREAQRLSRLVSDFLHYARPAPPSVAPVDLATLVDDTVASIRAAERATDGDVPIDVVVEERVVVLVDDAQVRQVLWNLVNNALAAVREHAGDASSRPARVQITVARRRGFGAVVIDDSGPGVSLENRARVFVPFFTTRAAGTGLGLPTAHQLVLGMGGDIDLEDSPLGGARFVVTMPLAEHGSVGAEHG